MAEKNYVEVNLMGKNYVLGGHEDEAYLQRVATYVNSRVMDLRKTRGYLRQSADMQHLLLVMNLADDYFKSQDKAEGLKARVAELEQEVYNLKHELVSNRFRREGY